MSKELFFEMREQEVAHLLTEVEEGNIAALSTYGNLKKFIENNTEYNHNTIMLN